MAETRIKLTEQHFAKLPEEKIDKAVGGLEYNGQGDFTVAVVELFKSDGTIEVLSRSWATNNAILEGLGDPARRSYMEDGQLDTVEKDFVSWEPIVEWFVDIRKNYDIKTIGYDPYSSGFIARELEKEGFETVSITQSGSNVEPTLYSLSELMPKISYSGTLFETYIKNSKIMREPSLENLHGRRRLSESTAGINALINSHYCATVLSEPKSTGDNNVKVNVEVSEAITGLKALQREAKAATKALAELREEQAKGPYKGEKVAGKRLVWLDEGEKIVPITEPTVYLDGKEIGKALSRESRTKSFRKGAR
ncbi:hypothetical protein HC660_26640 [Bacillus mojavensis]|uniref:Phage protein n=1 Tax=Bacillus mojavensis TaxID=72360 RepID=A0ABX6M2Z7_BACMO|nr:hypothetical protein [Bacillus mojavensis]QJC97138.1 hypothetical protein HC660_26640 [Bacillus mojavensis]